jgi:septal ring-binding cell division protein DamX
MRYEEVTMPDAKPAAAAPTTTPDLKTADANAAAAKALKAGASKVTLKRQADGNWTLTVTS